MLEIFYDSDDSFKEYKYLSCRFIDRHNRSVNRMLLKDECVEKADRELLRICGYYDYEIGDDLKTDDELEIKRNKFSVLITWKRRMEYIDLEEYPCPSNSELLRYVEESEGPPAAYFDEDEERPW